MIPLVLTLSCCSSKSPLPPSSSDEFSAFQPLQRELNLILKEIRVGCFLIELVDITLLLVQVITDKIKDDEDSAAVLADWRFAAMVLDR